jgi:hypothetical protein
MYLGSPFTPLVTKNAVCCKSRGGYVNDKKREEVTKAQHRLFFG